MKAWKQLPFLTQYNSIATQRIIKKKAENIRREIVLSKCSNKVVNKSPPCSAEVTSPPGKNTKAKTTKNISIAPAMKLFLSKLDNK